MKRRALCSKSLFHVFFICNLNKSKTTHKKHVEFLKSQKRIEKSCKSDLPTIIKDIQAF